MEKRQSNKSFSFETRIVSVFPVLLCFLTCSPNFRYPVEEIQRPLSLPPKNWGLSLSAGPGYFHSKDTSYVYLTGIANLPYGYFSNYFGYPFYSINDKLELHFTPLNFKYYLIKNTEIKDSSICISGINLAIGGGVSGLILNSADSIYIPLNFFFQFKDPINKKTWLFSKGIINYNQQPDVNISNELGADAEIGLGLQLDKNLYTTYSIGTSYCKNNERYQMLFDSYFQTNELLSFRIPMVWGYNVDKKWKIFLYGDVVYQTKKTIATNWALGFDYYW